MSSKRKGVMLFTLLLLSTYTYSAQSEVFIAQPVAQEKNHDTFVANNIAVGKVFEVVAEQLNKPIILSKLAAQKKVTGNFNLANADLWI